MRIAAVGVESETQEWQQQKKDFQQKKQDIYMILDRARNGEFALDVHMAETLKLCDELEGYAEKMTDAPKSFNTEPITGTTLCEANGDNLLGVFRDAIKDTHTKMHAVLYSLEERQHDPGSNNAHSKTLMKKIRDFVSTCQNQIKKAITPCAYTVPYVGTVPDMSNI